MPNKPVPIAGVAQRLKEKELMKWYGQIVIDVRCGKIVMVHETTTLKSEDFSQPNNINSN
jgi:hypothetical protein